MNIFRKTLIVAGISSIMLCTTAFATEVTVADNLNTQENSQTEIINEDNVQSEEIQVSETQETAVQAQVQEIISQSQLQQGTVSVNILNVRSGPSTDTEILGKLSLGSTINIKTTSNGWYEIEYNDSSAYIYAEYVKIIDLSAAALSPSGNSVIDYAKLFIGTPYVAGGSSPSGFDCSGFVKYVMANFGVDMPRTSTDQYSIGVRVEKSELMPGDLVFFKYSATSYRLNHVGVYVGDGNFIHSPIPGQTVKIDTLSSGYFSTYYFGATRVVK
jgi:cell wall-associated NlpC family hydrolase